ncbi:MAG: hypothetical protein ACYC1D_19305 [Acidimicrobiales bacterium]
MAPPLGLLEAVEGDLVAPERLDARGNVVTCLPGGRRLLAIGHEPLFEVPALFSAPPTQPGQRSEIDELPGGTGGKSLHGLQPGLRRAELLDGRSQGLAGISWTAGEDLLVFSDLVA